MKKPEQGGDHSRTDGNDREETSKGTHADEKVA